MISQRKQISIHLTRHSVVNPETVSCAANPEFGNKPLSRAINKTQFGGNVVAVKPHLYVISFAMNFSIR